jgi:hypothetical protein
MILGLVMAGFMAAAPSALETARDQQDRATLQKMVAEYSAAAAKAPNNADAQYRVALAASYLAEVSIEQHDRKQGRQAAEQGIKAAEKAISLKPEAEYYRVLATLCGQAITDVLSGLSYGPSKKRQSHHPSTWLAESAVIICLRSWAAARNRPSPISRRPSSSIPRMRKHTCGWRSASARKTGTRRRARPSPSRSS